MSTRRLSTCMAVIGVLLFLLPALATVGIHNSRLNSAFAGAISQKVSESKLAARDQKGLGYKLTPEQYARALAYSHGEYWLYFLTTAYTLLVLVAMIRWQFAPRLREWSERVSRRPWVQFLIRTPALLFGFTILLLPTDVAAQWHERKYSQSVQSWASWLGAWTTQEVVTLVGGTLIIALVYFAMRRSPRRWWLILWMIAVPLIVLIVFLQPLIIDPLFNTFEPLDRAHPALVDSIEAMGGSCWTVHST